MEATAEIATKAAAEAAAEATAEIATEVLIKVANGTELEVLLVAIRC